MGIFGRRLSAYLSPINLPNGLKAEYYDNPTFQKAL